MMSQRLKDLRKHHHLSQIELADITGIPAGTLATWESGRVQDIGAEKLRKLAPAYGMTPESLSKYLRGESDLDSTASSQPELYQAGGVQTMRLALVQVADVTIHAGLEAWRTVGSYSVPEELAVGRDVVMVRVVGDCMEPEIQAGDMVLIDRGQLSPRTGAMASRRLTLRSLRMVR